MSAEWIHASNLHLDDVAFDEGHIVQHPVEAEGRQIERRIAAMDYQLAEAASDRRRLLYAVTTETVREVKIRETRRPSDERIVIKHVHVVMAGPGTTSLESFKGGHPRGEDGPNVFVKKE